jgi:hypothetical protein
MEYTNVATPERCYADFCLIPVRFFNPPSSLINHNKANTIELPTHLTQPRPAGRHRFRLRRRGSSRSAEAATSERARVHDAFGGDDGWYETLLSHPSFFTLPSSRRPPSLISHSQPFSRSHLIFLP